MKNDEPDALDRALDKPLDNALAQYSSEEPLAGLEQRVLNRVRAEGAPPRSGFGRRVAAAGVAVVAGWGGVGVAVMGGNAPPPPPLFRERPPGPPPGEPPHRVKNGPPPGFFRK